jgi:ubiquinone/menaquinone biosynthesis C-methylase UbiE
MRYFTYLMIFCFCFMFLDIWTQNIKDEPLSKQPWSYFGPLSRNYALGRKEKPDVVYAILKSYVSPHATILDMGSGTGISTRQLCKNGFKNVIGVDRDLLMIHEAQFTENKMYPIKYIQADISLGLPFSDEQFDVVTASSAFHWFANPSSIQEIMRILKPHGYYFVIGGKIRNQQSQKQDPLKENIERILREFSVIKPQKSIPSFIQILEEQGFKIIVEATVFYANDYTQQEYLHYVQSQSYWNLVKESQRPSLLRKIGQYLESVVDEQGRIKKEGMLSVILAQKK